MLPTHILSEGDFFKRRLCVQEYESLVGIAGVSMSSDWTLIGSGTTGKLFSHNKHDIVIKVFTGRHRFDKGLRDVIGSTLVFDMLTNSKQVRKSDRSLFNLPVAWFADVKTQDVSILMNKCSFPCLEDCAKDIQWEDHSLDIITAMSKTSDVLVRHGLRHNDMYPRNVMYDWKSTRQTVLIDYGNVEIIHKDRLGIMPEELKSVKSPLFKCGLYGVDNIST